MNTIKTRNYLFTIIALFVFLSVKVDGQEKNGINFEQGLSWNQIKDKAKTEGKYIFVDVFATWCGPCKQMDKDVYTSRELGDYINDKFISVKVQIDSTKDDSEKLKAWYSDSKSLQIQYKIDALPSYLFFSPQGILIHRGIGSKSEKEFKVLVQQSLDSTQQYYRLLEDYKKGTKNYKMMPIIVKTADDLKEEKLALEIATDYVNNYLKKLTTDDILFTKANLSLIANHLSLLNSKDRLFQLIFKNQESANKLMDSKDYSEQVISIIIKKDEIYRNLWKSEGEFVAYTQNPDWVNMYHSIRTKFGDGYANELIPPSQLLFYQQTGNWKEYVKYVNRFIKTNPPKKYGKEFLKLVGNPRGGDYDNWGLNEVSWQLFLNCNDPILLKEALNWSNFSIQLAWCDLSSKQLSEQRSSNLHQYLDTKANLLYKLGRAKEAIQFEQRAIDVLLKSSTRGSEWEILNLKIYKDNIEKIKKRQQTWPVKKSS